MATLHKSKFGEPTSHQICVIYDPATGQIVHIHQYVTYPGGPTLTASEVQAQGLAVLARRMKTDVSGFHVLQVRPEQYQEGSKYRIELASPRLIKVDTE